MTFDELRRVMSQGTTFYQPLPTMLTIDFEDMDSYSEANLIFQGMQGQYWDFEFDGCRDDH